MDAIIRAVNQTPLPTILVVAGIFFLLLTVVSQFMGKITVAPGKQKWAGVIGAILLSSGIALQAIPSPQPGPNPPVPTPPAPAPPVPKPSPPIPSPPKPPVPTPPPPINGDLLPIQPVTIRINEQELTSINFGAKTVVFYLYSQQLWTGNNADIYFFPDHKVLEQARLKQGHIDREDFKNSVNELKSGSNYRMLKVEQNKPFDIEINKKNYVLTVEFHQNWNFANFTFTPK
jgi:hypothetical protein